VRKDIAKAEEQSFSFGDMLTKVGTIAGAIAGIATGAGAGAIVSIPAGIAALQSVIANGRERTLWDLLGALKNQPKDPKHPKTYEYDVLNAAKLGGDLKDLVSGAKDVISFVDVIDDLDAGASQAGQAEVAKLLKQQATLVRQQMVATLRETQAHSRVAAANLRRNNHGADIADIQKRLDQWEAKEAFPFWGRGVASTFRLQVALPSSLDLTDLSAIHVRLDCLGFAPQGSGTQPGVRPIRPEVRLLAAPMAVPAVR
jgi:hypothetical protein